MKTPSPFERVAMLPALAAVCRGVKSGAGTSAKKSSGKAVPCLHEALRGLIGSARSLAVGAVARARRGGARQAKKSAAAGPSVVLAVLESPEAAHELIADLKAFCAAEEAFAEDHAAKKSSRDKQIEKLTREQQGEETWADPARPAAASLPDELARGLALEAVEFPAWDVLPTESDRPEGLTLAGRRRTVDRLRDLRTGAVSASSDAPASVPLPEALVIATTITALMQPVESPSSEAGRLVLRAGATHDPILLGRKLADLGFDRTGQVEVRGEYALRGGILDVFPYSAERPFRIDFFGDEIESIAPFDPITQRSEDPVEALELADVSPRHLRALFSPAGSDSAGPFTLLDHLPPGALVAWDDPARLFRRAELYTASLVSGRSLHVPYDDLFLQAGTQFDLLELQPPAAEEDTEAAVEHAPSHVPDLVHDITCTSLQRLQGEISAHAMDWKKLAASRTALYVFCETGGDRKRLETLLKEANVLPAPSVKLVQGRLSGGFDLRSAGLAAISDREILGRRKHAESAPKRVQSSTSALRPIASLFELQLGDFVVHAAHGIARYLGIERLEKSGRLEDYLALQFADNVKLYVPAAHINLVSKYIGAAGSPEPSKLGGKSWQRKKERAQSALRDIAEDLLKVQAARRSLPGIVYGPDTDWQTEFEEAFPFDETPDQDTAIASVKGDMMGTCPMDRLLCGDVGFGKTEVAVRAAFKAACEGKQVAVLTPTTLLCEQHGRTFKERFAGYPVSVETLSRFKSRGEQKELLQRLAAGRLDVVVGTHRLLQKDVAFHNLGLAIIDEEQRFGVEHKEFFKKLRKTVDVLTLTATPIPRTLHMALLGLRDISNLQTPPRNRRSIVTKVARVSDDLLRRALLRELSRGGQVFVVHPRVYDIQEFAQRLQDLMPEARFDVGHGQMGGDKLEAVMEKFLHAETDILVSTTIVESGLDIPSANTILVHEANKFGLAELHQLRGRVGRSDLQAYCYLLLPEQSTITPEGLRRLRALEEFDELGAGFQLALKDLEIRGAGNVLGVEQSGSIADIGYDLYCKLLESTVRSIKGQPPAPEELEVNLQLREGAFIPDDYIEDEKAVLECYRRLNTTTSDPEVKALKAEMEERFGPMPPPCARLFEEAKLRRLAREAGVPYVGYERVAGRLSIKLHGWDMKLLDRALRGMPALRGVRILDDETLSFKLDMQAQRKEAGLRALVRNLLEPLRRFRLKFGSKEGSEAGPARRAPSLEKTS